MKKQTITMLMATIFLYGGQIIAMQESKLKQNSKRSDRRARQYGACTTSTLSDLSGFIITKHAKDRMAERSISDEALKSVMINGDQYDTAKQNVKRKVCTIQKIVVVFNEKRKTVLTTYPIGKRSLSKYKTIKQGIDKAQLGANANLEDVQPNDGESIIVMQKSKQKSDAKRSDQARLEDIKDGDCTTSTLSDVSTKNNETIKPLHPKDRMTQPSISNDSVFSERLMDYAQYDITERDISSSPNNNLELASEDDSISTSIKPIEVMDYTQYDTIEKDVSSSSNNSLELSSESDSMNSPIKSIEVKNSWEGYNEKLEITIATALLLLHLF